MFVGVGLYLIVPFVATWLDMNAWGAGMAPGAAIKTSTRVTPPSINDLWQIVALNKTTDVLDAEYLIVSKQTGYFLAAKGDFSYSITAPQISPADPLCHWWIRSSPSAGYPTFVIQNKASGAYASVQGGSGNFGTDIITEVFPPGASIPDRARWGFDPL